MIQRLPHGLGVALARESMPNRRYEVVVKFTNGDEAGSLEFFDTKKDAWNGVYRFAHYCELAYQEGYKLKCGTHDFYHPEGYRIGMWEFLAADSDEEFIELLRTRGR